MIWILSIVLSSCTESSYEVKNYFQSGKLESAIRFKSKSDTLNYTAVFYREDGTVKCTGQRINGKKSGKWRYYNNSNQIISIENFCNGLLCDTQAAFYPDGMLDRYKILDQPIPCFCDTQLHYGFTQVAFWRNRKLKEINHIKNCQFNGKTQLFDSLNGRLYEEYYEVNGVKNGAYSYHNPDGSFIKGQYRNGNEHGNWTHALKDSIIDMWKYK